MAHALIRKDCEVTVLPMGDAVSGAKTGQKTPDGFYNAGRMVKRAVLKGKVLLCGTCMDARASPGRKWSRVPGAAPWMNWRM